MKGFWCCTDCAFYLLNFIGYNNGVPQFEYECTTDKCPYDGGYEGGRNNNFGDGER